MSDQNVLKVEIHGKSYPITCKKGEEDRVSKSAALLNEIINSIENEDNKISENRIMLMASLIIADKYIRNRDINKFENKADFIDTKEFLSWLEQINLKFNKVASLIDES